FYSLASGFLTGKYRSKADLEGRIRAPRVEKYVTEDGFRVLDALDEVAQKHNAKIGQVALAWLMARSSVTSPIASATNMDQLAELTAAANVTMDADDIAKIDEASK
ncbi:MAG: aldo/keto reductase, partial [Pseudomonadota bacterium]|nr:aldo/keto reductase [Pseudomonadota bacterium]